MAASASFAERFKSRAVATLWRILSGWQPASLWRLARLVGPLIQHVSRRERRVTRINLGQAYPELDESARRQRSRDSLVHSSATMLELGFAWLGDARRVSDSIQEVHGRELLDDARDRGQGVIVLAPHFGNWEVLNFWLSSHFPSRRCTSTQAGSARPYHPPGARASGGTPGTHQPSRRGRPAQGPETHRGGRHPPGPGTGWGSGVFAPFFGRQAYTATLLPKLVARTEARVVTGVARRLPGRGFAIHFLAADERVYDSNETTSAAGVNASVEAAIALDPAQYQWEYKRYRKTPEEAEQRPDWKRFRLYR